MFSVAESMGLGKLLWEYKDGSLDENKFIISNVDLLLGKSECA